MMFVHHTKNNALQLSTLHGTSHPTAFRSDNLFTTNTRHLPFTVYGDVHFLFHFGIRSPSSIEILTAHIPPSLKQASALKLISRRFPSSRSLTLYLKYNNRPMTHYTHLSQLAEVTQKLGILVPATGQVQCKDITYFRLLAKICHI